MEAMQEAGVNEDEEDVRSDWLDLVFDTDSRLEEDDFRKACGNSKMIWLFDPDMLRKKLAKKAGLDETMW